MKLLFRRRKRKNLGTDRAPKIKSRVGNRRDFRIKRLQERTKLLSQRKWVFLSIAVIVVAIAVVVMKIM